MEELITQIANIGFPIVMASYLLVRMENKLSELNNTILELSHSIKLLNREE